MNEKTKMNLIGASIAFVTVGSSIFLAINHFTARTESAPTPEVVVQTSKPVIDVNYAEGRAIEAIKNDHEELNTWVGWKNDKNFKKAAAWDSALSADALNPSKYRELANALSDIQGAEIDLDRLARLAAIAREKRDIHSLIQMHRVLHDLDDNYFDKTPGSDYWGVTETVLRTAGDKVVNDNRSEVAQFIEKNYDAISN